MRFIKAFFFILIPVITGCKDFKEKDFSFAAYTHTNRPVMIVINGRDAATVTSYGQFRVPVQVPRGSDITGPDAYDYIRVSITVSDPVTKQLLANTDDCSISSRSINTIEYEPRYGYVNCRY